MRKMLAIAIPAVMAAGLVAAAVNEPDPELTASNPGVVNEEPGPAVIEVPATEPTTTTTVAPAPPPPAETTTTSPPPTTPPTTARATVTTRPRTQTTTAAAPKAAPKQSVDCGTGTALANVEGYDTGTDYRIRVTVINKTNQHIEIDSLSFTAIYDGIEKVYNLPVAGQRVIASGDPANNPTTVVIEVPDSASPKPPSAFTPPSFKFHTAGLPQCASA
jgi:hypothetical protein